MSEHASRRVLGPIHTVCTHSEAGLISLLQQSKRPISDVSFLERGETYSSVGSIQLGNLTLGEASGDPSIVTTKIECHPSFCILTGGGQINERLQSIAVPPSRSIVRYTYAHPMEIRTRKVHVVTIRPDLSELTEAIGQLSQNSALIDRLTSGFTSVHSGQFRGLNYCDLLDSIFYIIRNAQGDGSYLERIGVPGVLNRLLAEYVVAEAEQPRAELPVEKLPRSSRAVDLICGHIEDNIGTPLTVPRMEKLTGMTGRALNYAFQARFNCSPQEWQRNFLLDNARRRLLDPSQSQSVKTVAFDLGFSSSSAFSTFYRRRFGELPSATIAHASAQPKLFTGTRG